MSHVTPHARPQGVYPALSHSNISDLQVWDAPSPLCSVISLLNIVLLTTDIIGLLLSVSGLIWI